MKKIDQLVIFIKNEQWQKALSLAAKFPRLGSHKEAIVGGHEALTHPAFYRQLHKDVDLMVEAGKAALLNRYSSYL